MLRPYSVFGIISTWRNLNAIVVPIAGAGLITPRLVAFS